MTNLAQPARIQATVVQTIDHARGVRTLELRPDRTIPPFRPGQFLHLAMDPYDPSSHWPESRVFSIASPPEQLDRLRITFSEKGDFTRRMMTLGPDAKVWIKLPFGDFVVDDAASRPVVLVAGGTGITPFLSLLDSRAPLKCPIALLYGVRSVEFIIGRDIMERATRRDPPVRVEVFVESGTSLGCTVGRLSAAAAARAGEEVGGMTNALYYLSGPPEMVQALSRGLRGMGIRESSLRVDAW